MRFRSCITAPSLSLLMMLGVSCTAIGQPGAAQHDSVRLQAFSEGEGAPIIMLGGGTFGAAAFAAHAKILAKQFRVVRLQALNVEKSQKKEPDGRRLRAVPLRAWKLQREAAGSRRR